MIQIAKALGKAPKYKLEIHDVITDFNGSPHRIIKMVISGNKFPIRNAPIFVRIRNEGKIVEESWLIEMSANSDQIIGFFSVDFTQNGNVEFGIGDEIFGVFKNPKWKSFKKLDDNQIEKDVQIVNKKWLKLNTFSNITSSK